MEELGGSSNGSWLGLRECFVEYKESSGSAPVNSQFSALTPAPAPDYLKCLTLFRSQLPSLRTA